MGSHYLLQGIFQTQGLNPGLLHWRQILYCLNKRYAKFPQNDKFYWNIIEYLDELKCITFTDVSHSQIRKLSIIKVSLLSQLVIDSMQCQPKTSKKFCCCIKKKKNEFCFPTSTYCVGSHHILFPIKEILIYSLYYSKHLLCFFMLIPRCHPAVPAFQNWSVWILKINNVGSNVLTGCVRTWISLRLHKIHQKMREEKMNSQKFNKNIFVFTDDHILVQKCIPNIQASGVLSQKLAVFPENLCTW